MLRAESIQIHRNEGERKQMEEQWRERITELTKNGFPQSDGQVWDLFEAYSYVNTTEEEIENIMTSLACEKFELLISKPDSGVFSFNSWRAEEFSMRDFVVSTVMFWMDEHYYYVEPIFDCGCCYICEWEAGTAPDCWDININLLQESDKVFEKDGIIRIDRQACRYNQILPIEISPSMSCMDCDGFCHPGVMAIIFAPCYYEKHYSREND